MIRFDNVTIRFNDKVVIRDFSLDINKGDKIVIRGKSGIGKSTLFRLILGFAKPEKGSVLFEEKKLDKQTVWDVRKKIAYVSQDLDIAEGTVRSIIEQTFEFKHNEHLRPGLSDIQRLFDLFELDRSILDKEYSELSGGEKQRVAIVVSILLKRDIFLLDESTSALDDKLSIKVIDYFLNKTEWTVVAISHGVEWERNNAKVISLEEA
ncbi:ATP-binding cassette domain-containing protein [candidate division KSB1 bacterium]